VGRHGTCPRRRRGPWRRRRAARESGLFFANADAVHRDVLARVDDATTVVIIDGETMPFVAAADDPSGRRRIYPTVHAAVDALTSHDHDEMSPD
jgi:hypothetical protein